jgi:hypothetical protein
MNDATEINAKQRELLQSFDAVASPTSHGTSLSVSLELMGDPSELRPLAEELAARGWLRRGEGRDVFALTEDGRLELAAPLDVTLYTRPGCHLCDEAKGQIAPLLRSAGARLREVNIDADDVLRGRYNVDVPVLFLGARKVAKHRVDLKQFQRQLKDAAKIDPRAPHGNRFF